MPLLPESTNAHYEGARASAWFLGIAGVLTIVPGCIHFFLPDGGAGVIGGLDLSANRHLIVGAFAWMGSMQIPYGIAQLLVATRYRSFVPLFLALGLLERSLVALAGWVTKAPPTGHHPPGHYGTLVALPLLVLFLVLSLRRSASAAVAPLRTPRAS